MRGINSNLSRFIFCVLVLFCILLVFQSVVFGMDNVNETLTSSSENNEEYNLYSEEYKEYLKLTEEEKAEVGVIPDKYEYTIDEYIATYKSNEYVENISAYSMSSSRATSTPSKFDLRNKISIKVENQGSEAVCWTFATLGTLETHLALKNKGEYDFSERHLDYLTSSDKYPNKTGRYSNRKAGTSGHFESALWYYMNNDGPVLERDVPYNGNTKTLTQMDSMKPVVYVHDTIKFPSITKKNGKSYNNSKELTTSQLNSIRNDIKTHIINNGGLYCSIRQDNDFSDSNHIAFYDDGSKSVTKNHAVVIIGWDDNYSKDNFKGKYKPRNNGAYLALNSYGTNYGDNGYIWISYEDCNVEFNLQGILSADTNKNELTLIFENSKVYNRAKSIFNKYPMTSNDTWQSIVISDLVGVDMTELIFNNVEMESEDLKQLFKNPFKHITKLNLDNNKIDTFIGTNILSRDDLEISAKNQKLENTITNNTAYGQVYPNIFKEAMNSKSKLYSNKGLTYVGCKDVNGSIIFTGNSKNISVTIESGILAGSKLTIEDKAKPIIEKVETTQNGYNVTLTVTAKDSISGLADRAYSFDGGKTWQSSNQKTYTSSTEGRVAIQVIDKAGNIESYNAQSITLPTQLNYIEITRSPYKTTYQVGDYFDTRGMIVTAIYYNGTRREVTNYTVEGGNDLTLGQRYVTIRYTEGGITKTTTQNITVQSQQLTGIEITREPYNIIYEEGEDFDITGMIVTARYNDGSSKKVTNYKVEDGKYLALGQRYVTISYTEGGITAKTTQNIIVELPPLSSIEITKAPDKTTYQEGENFDTTGMVVTAKYTDGFKVAVKKYVVEDGNNLVAGKKTVTISYTEGGITKTTTQKITVESQKLSSINITKEPNKTTYQEGENFDTRGMIVTATYSNEYKVAVTNYSVEDGNNLTEGKKTVTISYTEDGITKTTTQKITVNKKLKISFKGYAESQDETNRYITNINPDTTVGELLKNIETNGAIRIYKGSTRVTNNNTKIGTGMNLQVILNDEKVEYIAIVKGDIDGNGKISITDLIKTKLQIANIKKLSEIEKMAADINRDGRVNITDLVKLKLAIVNIKPIK